MNDWLPVQLLPAAWLVGWTLLHFAWQATLVAAVTGLVLGAMGRRRASARYAVCAGALVALAAAPVVTLLVLTGAEPTRLPPVALATLLVTRDLRRELLLLVPGVSVVWGVGVLVMNVRLVAQLVSVRALAREGHAPLPEPLRGAARSLCRSLGMRRTVDVVLSTRAAVPMVVGWLRPVVLVPTAALAGLSTAQLRAVLAHELAHVRRHDALVNLAQTVLETLFFFHPAVWWLSHRTRVEREFCCDDVAVDTCGDRLTYARALVALDDLRVVRPAPAPAATGGSLMQRITRLLDSGASRRTARPLAGWLAPAAATLALTAVVTAMAPAHDEEAAAEPLAGVDLVEVVAPVDAELAKILGVLRESGLDDATLLEVVGRMGTTPDVLDAIAAARRRAEVLAAHRELETRLAEAKASVHADLEAGRITEEEAELRMADARREVEAWVASQGGKQALHEALGGRRVVLRSSDGGVVPSKVVLRHDHLRVLEEKAHAIHQKVRVGELPPEEGQAVMQKLHHELKKAHVHVLEAQDQEVQGKVRVRTKRAPAQESGAATGDIGHVPDVLGPGHEHAEAHDAEVDLLFGDDHGPHGVPHPDHDHAVHPHAHPEQHAPELEHGVTSWWRRAMDALDVGAAPPAEPARLGLEKAGWTRLVRRLDDAQQTGDLSGARVRSAVQALVELDVDSAPTQRVRVTAGADGSAPQVLVLETPSDG